MHDAERGGPVRLWTSEWRDLFNSEASVLPDVPGATATVEVVVTLNTGVTTTHALVVQDGRVTVELGPAPHHDARAELEEDDYAAMRRGDIDLMAAYSMGRLRVSGDLEKLVAVAPVLDSAAFHQVEDRLREQTALP
ncbi:MAG: sterol transfer family [Acidimicrobiales bacterium]|nr:sterol transfer family [Acidimicrobiales bacterium]